MKCCPHLQSLSKKSNNNNREANHQTNSDLHHLEKLFKLVIELNRGKSSHYEGSASSNNLKCSSCEQMNRLYVCVHCFSVSCLSHIEQHWRLKSHPLFVEISYAAVYCHLCRDFQYDRFLEEFVRELFLKEGFFPFGNLNLYQVI